MIQVRRRVAALLAALGVLTGAATLGVVALDAPAAHAADSRAVVVVDTGGSVHRTVISFSGSVSGLQALQLAGANPATYGYPGQGSAVCALDGVGHDATQSSCLGTLADPRYWAYFRSPAGSSGWAYSRSCACTTTVHDGDVEGWRYGTGEYPPYASFCSVAGCAPPPTAAPPTAPPTAAPPPSVQGTAVTAPPAGGASGSSSGGAGGASGGGSKGSAAPGGSGATSAAGGNGAAASDPSASGDSSTTGGRRDSGSRALGASSDHGSSGPSGSSDGGSPWGVIVAVVLVAVIVGGAWWVRRTRAAGARPG